MFVKEGQWVKQGEVIGAVGSTDAPQEIISITQFTGMGTNS
jgi:septal ring factor EnvC (AmiA/AmiB activator)